jgi:hypothetical protein
VRSGVVKTQKQERKPLSPKYKATKMVRTFNWAEKLMLESRIVMTDINVRTRNNNWPDIE